MTMGHHQQTATILPFRNPRVSAAQGAPAIGKTDGATKGQRPSPVAYHDSWYHQAAIEEDARSRKP
jgi:hypothetical protein